MAESKDNEKRRRLLGLLALFGYVVIVWLIGRAVGYSAAENEALFLPKTEDRE